MISRSIVKNTLSGYLRFLVPFAIGIMLTPFVIARIGIPAYGLWALVLSTTGYFALLDLGFGQAIVRYVAMNKATGNRDELNRLISTFVVVYGLVTCVIVAATVFLSINAPSFFRISSEEATISQWAFLISGLGMALRFPLNIFGGLLYGYQRYDLAFGTEVFFNIVNAVLTVVLLNLGYGLLALMLSASGTSLASGLVVAFNAFRVVGRIKISLRQFQLKKVTEILSFSIFFFMVSMAVMISHRSDAIVIGVFLPTTAVAIYAISLKLADLVSNLASQLNNILFPVAAELHALADPSKIRGMLLEGSRLSVALAAGLGMGVAAIGRPFIGLWVGPEFLAGYPVLVVLIAVAVAMVAQDLPAKVLMITGKQRLLGGIALLGSVANAILSIILVQFLGILGVALGTLFPFFAVACFNTAYACRCVRLSPRSFFLALAFPGLLPGLMAAAVLWTLQAWSYPQTWFALGWQGAAGVAVFGVACLALGIVRPGRQAILARIQPGLVAATLDRSEDV